MKKLLIIAIISVIIFISYKCTSTIIMVRDSNNAKINSIPDNSVEWDGLEISVDYSKKNSAENKTKEKDSLKSFKIKEKHND